MRSYFCLTSLIATSWIHADPAEISGEISEGKNAPGNPVQLVPVDQNQLERDPITVQSEGRTITYQELSDEAPDQALKLKSSANASAPSPLPSDVELLVVSYSVSATVFPGPVTLVKWWNGPNINQAWSNVNFRHFEGFHSFEKDETIFQFQLFVTGGSQDRLTEIQSSAETDPSLIAPPVFEDGQVAYLPFADLDDTSSPGQFLLGLHEIYANRKTELKAASVVRDQKRAAARLAKESPQPPQDVVFRYRVTVDPPEAEDR
jgi:hypothetical protein